MTGRMYLFPQMLKLVTAKRISCLFYFSCPGILISFLSQSAMSVISYKIIIFFVHRYSFSTDLLPWLLAAEAFSALLFIPLLSVLIPATVHEPIVIFPTSSYPGTNRIIFSPTLLRPPPGWHWGLHSPLAQGCVLFAQASVPVAPEWGLLV